MIKQVCLQFPDELLGVSAIIYEEIKKRAEVDLYILGDTSYARYLSLFNLVFFL